MKIPKGTRARVLCSGSSFELEAHISNWIEDASEEGYLVIHQIETMSHDGAFFTIIIYSN